MTLSAAHQTQNVVKPNRLVYLNLGLLGGSSSNRLLPPQRTVLYSTALTQIMRFFKSEVQFCKETGEPTMVASGYFTEDAAVSTWLLDTVTSAGQDCIAILYPYWPGLGEEEGFLFGPCVENWAPFDIAKFLIPSFPQTDLNQWLTVTS
jgi:hypothetical protein